MTIERDGRQYKVRVKEFVFLVELEGLSGRRRLESIAPVTTLMKI